MIICKCDRCGKEENINAVYPYIFGDEEHKPKFFITKNEESSVKMIHLCPNCEEKLDEFLNIEEQKEKINKEEVPDDSQRLMEIYNPRHEKFTNCTECIHDGDTEERCKQRGCTHAFAYLQECFDPKDCHPLLKQLKEGMDEINHRYSGRNVSSTYG